MAKTDKHPDETLDALHGAKAIGDYLGIDVRRTFYLLEKGELPATKLGALWVASKRKLRERVAPSRRKLWRIRSASILRSATEVCDRSQR